MTILQNAYKGYLTKKYEKEINDFKECSLKVVSGEIKTYENLALNQIKIGKSIDVDKFDNYRVNLNELTSIVSKINNDPLNLEENTLSTLGLWSVLENYNNLNDLIVEGESKFIVFKEVQSSDAGGFDIDSTSGLVKAVGTLTEKTGNQIGEAMKKLEKSLSDVPYDYYSIKINTSQNNASQFAKDIMDKIKKTKGGSF